jgi:serine/threonine protein kinase
VTTGKTFGDEAEGALARNEWQTALERSRAALALDRDNADARHYLEAAKYGLTQHGAVSRPPDHARTSTPAPPDTEPAYPSSFANGRYTVKKFLGEERDSATGIRQPFMVLPLMNGGDVEGVIEKAPEQRVPLDRVLQIARDTCEGLVFAQSEGIAHRDLKPGNVWLTDPSMRLGARGGPDRRLRACRGHRPLSPSSA